MTSDRLPRFHKLAPQVISFSGYNGRGIAPGTAFGRLLAEYIAGTVSDGDLPLPVTELRIPALRVIKRSFFDLGSQLAHLAQARL
jgi:sarcosine oxidase